MSEVIVQFTESVLSESGQAYVARVCGEAQPDGIWQGWIEFVGEAGAPVLRTDRETTQPNRGDLEYWATGISAEYLKAALGRALDPEPVPVSTPIAPPKAPPPVARRAVSGPVSGAVLDPFAVYAQGEGVLRRELGALSMDHLHNIVRAYDLSDDRTLAGARAPEVVELIVSAVRRRMQPGGNPSVIRGRWADAG